MIKIEDVKQEKEKKDWKGPVPKKKKIVIVILLVISVILLYHLWPYFNHPIGGYF